MSIKLIFLECLVIISTSLWATDAGEFRGETKAKIEILQKQNDELKTKIAEIEKNNINIEVIKNSIIDQDKRIQDLSLYVSITATIIAILTLIAGVGGVAFPYVMYKQNTKAQESAKKDIESWKEKTKLEFNNELESFKNHAQDAKNKINTSVEEVKKSEEEMKNLQNILLDKQVSPLNESNNDSSLSKMAKIMREKPQVDYSYKDWQTLAFDAYQQNKYEDALFYWRKILEVNEILPFAEALTLLNIAVVLNKLNRKEEELRFHDELIQKFQGTPDEAIQEIIARSTLLKGITLRQLDRNEEALVTFDTLIRTFINSQNDKIKESIAIAQGAKGTLFLKLNEYQKAIEAFNELILQFNNTQNNVILERKANAFIGKGISLRNLNTKATIEEAIEVYSELVNTFKYTQNNFIKEQIAQAFVYRLKAQLLINKIVDEKLDDTILSILSNNQKYQIRFMVLQVLKDALTFDQTERIKQLKNEISSIDFEGDWSWDELDYWANYLDNIEAKARVLATIEQFKNW